MAFIGPVTLVRRTAARLANVGWARAAGSLSFATLLALVPLATVAFAFVAKFPVFQDFLHTLERFLLRHMLPGSASTLVNTYVVQLAADAAEIKGLGILFVAITAALLVATLEDEINVIWGNRQKRPLARRFLVYLVGLTVGPVLIGASISASGWLLALSFEVVPLEDRGALALLRPMPFLIELSLFVLLYRVAPACHVQWRHALLGGLVATTAFELTKRGFSWYVGNVANYESLYGALAALPAFMLWIFLGWMIVLAGAALTATIADSRARR